MRKPTDRTLRNENDNINIGNYFLQGKEKVAQKREPSYTVGGNVN